MHTVGISRDSSEITITGGILEGVVTCDVLLDKNLKPTVTIQMAGKELIIPRANPTTLKKANMITSDEMFWGDIDFDVQFPESNPPV